MYVLPIQANKGFRIYALIIIGHNKILANRIRINNITESNNTIN